MDLNSIIPKSGEWKISKNRAFIWNVAWLAVFDIISDSEINIFLDLRNSRSILKLVKNLQKTDYIFYFISPVFADPGQDKREYNDINIKNYLRNYSKIQFYDGFQKIEYDFIGNLIDYCKKEKCIELIKDIYENVNKEVQQKSWDYYTNKQYYDIKRDDIRETFNSLYRDIQLQQILR
jgi:hypothetical protein